MEIDHKEVMRDALLSAATTMIANGEEDVPPHKLVLRVLSEAMDTLRRMPDPEAAWLNSERSLWPDAIHSYEERVAAYLEELKRWVSGEDAAAALRRRMPAHPVQIKRMHVIFEDFPKMLVGQKRRRDYRIMCAVASGKSHRRVAKDEHCHHSTCQDVIDLQAKAIAHRMQAVMPRVEDINRLRDLRELANQTTAAAYEETSSGFAETAIS